MSKEIELLRKQLAEEIEKREQISQEINDIESKISEQKVIEKQVIAFNDKLNKAKSDRDRLSDILDKAKNQLKTLEKRLEDYNIKDMEDEYSSIIEETDSIKKKITDIENKFKQKDNELREAEILKRKIDEQKSFNEKLSKRKEQLESKAVGI